MNCISLGYFCSIAIDLEKLGLRKESSPFDWTISDLVGVIYAIENNFNGFLEEEFLCQSKLNRSHYQNIRYGVQFFHDFDAYRPLSEQLPLVQEKYDRRIKRFYKSISEPTLFIRYISDEEKHNGVSVELLWIEEHYRDIVRLLKSFNKENEIIFIANSGVNSSVVEIYHVEKDNNDTVCRMPIFSCGELMNVLSSIEVEDKEKNIERYLKKEKERRSIIYTLKKKLKTMIQKAFLTEYHHTQEY